MMKAPAVLLLVIGLSFYSTTQVNSNPVRKSRALNDDLADFLVLLPQDEIVSIFFEYLETDAEVQFVVDYVQTPEFRELVKAIEAVPEVRNFVMYLEDSGLRVIDYVNKLHEVIGLPPIRSAHKRYITGGVAGLIADIKNILPIDDIKDLYYYKLDNSVEFQELISRLQSPRFNELIHDLYMNDEFMLILETLRGFGVDLHAIADLLYTVLGIELPRHVAVARDVSSSYVNFDDFKAAVSVEKIRFVVDRYMKHDDEIKTIMSYMKTDDFKEVLKIVHHLDTVNYFYQYLDQSKFNIYPIVDRIHDSLMEHHELSNSLKMTNSDVVPPTRGLHGLIDELLFSLPLMEWHKLYMDKIVNDEAFVYFIERVKSDDFKMTVKNIFVDVEFKSVVDRMKTNGFDITPIIDVVSIITGIDEVKVKSRMFKSNSREIHQDFHDFIELLPKDEIMQISIKYYLTDSQVNKAVEYLRSDEFKELALKFQQDDEFHELVKYFVDSGADVVELINMANSILGIPDFPVSKITTLQVKQTSNPNDHKTKGMQGMLNEIRAVIPYEDIKKMYQLKMEFSQHFQYFVERMQAPEHQQIIDKLVQNENVLALAYQAHMHGIDIGNIGEFLFDLFGLKFPENPFGY